MRKDGLTLVELTVALTLSALLVTAALSAAAQLARGQRQAESAPADDSAQARLKELITLDLVHGQSWRPTKDGLAIQTWSCLDSRTRALSHRPVTVIYEVRRVGEQSWLWRRQQGQSKSDEWADLVGSDVQRVTLVTKSRPAAPVNDWRALPDELMVELTGTGPPAQRWTIGRH